jgi:hypothetical protein
MLVTPAGRFTDVKPLQPAKALFLMLVTPCGMFTDVKPMQPEKALLPMRVTPAFITAAVM